uniref:Uncharacterized protein n=1 Tax=mine drainage metagenome TaxID=410659 RepID=E6QQF8_9ZZZZ
MFQSSPTPEGGRYLTAIMCAIRKRVFQSSPTPEGGRYALRSPGWPTAKLVSILAHPGGWALPEAGGIFRSTTCFNPRPPRRVGATPWSINSGVASSPVSILAHPGGWALHAHRQTQIQSATVSILNGFNPRPPRRVGATFIPSANDAKFTVSILAHPGGWALPGRRNDKCAKRRGFNPRPPRRVGATLRGHVNPCYHKKFQSSPTPEGGRYFDARGWESISNGFQSSPTPEGGRYGLAVAATVMSIGFNPRPPRRVGATTKLALRA